MNGLLDRDIAHIARVMRPSLTGDLGGPILSSSYWRTRLHRLLEAPMLTKAQLCSIDSLLLELDEFDAGGFGVMFPQPVDGNDGARGTHEAVQSVQSA
ncbi:hypothetical protein [Paraburkholderia rhizosphaerae]|uniref:Uncharacterized protein n=1 Tax=Paraburkholderia rhizosphaerae TaxID=480658 RepID=A0A4R8LYF7_9BURK|nr:hypothetical protein [Paraburkholderia rhizosphaerae]TDY51716.1 hypothetical protein BX592_10610 [Paraburkholderia rhizosphaerae]